MLAVARQAARACLAARLVCRAAGAQRAWASVWAVAVVPISGLPTPIVAAPFWPALVASWPVPVMPGLATSAPGGVVWAKAGTANIIAVPSRKGLSIDASPVLVSERVPPRTSCHTGPFHDPVAWPGRSGFAVRRLPGAALRRRGHAMLKAAGNGAGSEKIADRRGREPGLARM